MAQLASRRLKKRQRRSARWGTFQLDIQHSLKIAYSDGFEFRPFFSYTQWKLASLWPGWKHIVICQTNLHEDDGFDMMRLSTNLEALLLTSNIIVDNKEIFSAVEGYQSYKRALSRLARYGRGECHIPRHSQFVLLLDVFCKEYVRICSSHFVY